MSQCIHCKCMSDWDCLDESNCKRFNLQAFIVCMCMIERFELVWITKSVKPITVTIVAVRVINALFRSQ